jgi:hypothetical protein
MRYTISEETIKKTTKCNKDMKCLVVGKCGDCAIEKEIGGRTMYIKMRATDICPYMISFGNGFICTRSTRQELHERYGV